MPEKTPRALEEIAHDLSNEIYAVAAKYYEEAEHARLINGNGHHMAQHISIKAKEYLIDRKKSLTDHKKSLSEIKQFPTDKK